MIGLYTGQKGESNFEHDFIELLTQVGWDKDIIKDATHEMLEANLRNIINENNIDKLGRNHLLTDGEFAQIMDKINSDCTTPVAANVFINGKQVVIKSEIMRPHYCISDEIYLDIFDPVQIAGGKSRYQIAEQTRFDTSAQYNNRIADIILLINGLPVIHIELKAAGVKIENAEDQIQKYMNEGCYKGLFSLIQVFFVATPDDIKYFANTYPKVNKAFIFRWADENNEAITDWKELIKGPNQILSIPEAHQLIGCYISASVKKNSNGCVDNVNDGVLMVARSYQVHAIRNIVKCVRFQIWGTHDPLGGYVWGTTGCGKTFTSYKSGQLIIDMNYADKVVFVVDRVELSDQSYDEYNSFARDGEPVVKSSSTYDLFKLLKDKNTKLIITSIQKLSRLNEQKSKYVDDKFVDNVNDKRIVFIVDEAHRSQFGEMHEQIKNTFVNALFIGFTGTPIFSENDKEGMTSEIAFGTCLAKYSIKSGIKDGNVLGFDPKMVKTFYDNDLREAIACDKAKVSKPDDAKLNPEKWKVYQKFYKLDMIEIEKLLPKAQYDTDEHRQAVVDNIVNNWTSLSVGCSNPNLKFHALFATSSIPEAIKYYRLFKGTGLKVTALFDPNLSGDNQNTIDKEQGLVEIIDDYNNMFPGININRDTDPSLESFKKDVTARLSHKKPYENISDEDMLDIVIVVDQLLTGFDSKYINTLYLDKVLEMDNLIQAISRTNRVLNNDEKPWGIFKYYRMPYTMSENIKKALELYCEGCADSGVVVSNIDINLQVANDTFDTIKKLFDDEGIKDFRHNSKDETICRKFQAEFRLLKQTINGMKLQGMTWKDDNDKYVMQLKCCAKWIDGVTRLYDILNERYKDLSPTKTDISGNNTKYGYNLIANTSEHNDDNVDADYLEKQFRNVIAVLMTDLDEKERLYHIDEFKKQLAILPEQYQRYAEIIIEDVSNGRLNVGDKTLRILIAEYQANEISQKIIDFADKYGLNSTLLHKAYNEVGNCDLIVSKLLETCDIAKVMESFNCNKLSAKGKLNTEIRKFIEV